MWGGMGSGGNGMMGGQYPNTGANATPTAQATTNSALPIFGAVFAVLIGVMVVGVVGVAYYLVYPQMRFGADPATTQPVNSGVAYESVAKTLTEDERKIVGVLQAHQGKYLQKYIKNETGLSRLQTHRIIARLSDRGIVSLEKTGNTNQVYLASWLNQKK